MDKAPGAVDIYAQHKEAGYSLTGDAYYCAAGDVLSVKTADASTGTRCYNYQSIIGGGCGTSSFEQCFNGASCKNGYVAVVGTCDTGGKCDSSGTSLSQDSCPYRCIPIDSVFSPNVKDGDLSYALKDDTGGNAELKSLVGPNKSCYNFLQKYVQIHNIAFRRLNKEVTTLTAFSMGEIHHNEEDEGNNSHDSNYVNEFLVNCITYGVDSVIPGSTKEYACTNRVKVSDGISGQNKAWTNRLNNYEPNFEIETNSIFAYSSLSPRKPFGAAELQKQDAPMIPLVFPVCRSNKDITLPNPIDFNKCPQGYNLFWDQNINPLPSRPYQFSGAFKNMCGNQIPVDALVCLSKSPWNNNVHIFENSDLINCLKNKNPPNTVDYCNTQYGLRAGSLSTITLEQFNKWKNAQKATCSAVTYGVCKLKSKFNATNFKAFCQTDTDCGEYDTCLFPKVCTYTLDTSSQPAPILNYEFNTNVLSNDWSQTGNNQCESPADCINLIETALKGMCVKDTDSTGVQFSCKDAEEQKTITTNIDQGVKRIQQIFASVMQLERWKSPIAQPPYPDNFGSYKPETFNKVDNAFELGKTSDGGLPPQLHPIDGQNNNAEVKNAGQGFSVNGAYGIPANTPASSGKPSGPAYLVQDGQLLANLSFYGFADKNHMPLRRIAIDWGDGSDIVGGEETNPVNYYKNKREKCDTGEPGVGGGWAGDSTACTSGDPFSYQHPYLFKKAEQDPTHCGNASVKLSAELSDLQKQFTIGPNTQVCVYTPKVQLLDNWGWCNATDSGGNTPTLCKYDFPGGVAGCYADGTSGNDKNECSVDQYKTKNPNKPYPWTEFQGKIIVLPPAK